MLGRLKRAEVCAVVLAVWVAAACHPATAQGGAGGCAPPPAWPQPGAKPGQPDAELAACLEDRAHRARGVRVPLDSKVAGVIAQCEVDVDHFEGALIFGGGTDSEEERAAVERQAREEAEAALVAYQGCGAG